MLTTVTTTTVTTTTLSTTTTTMAAGNIGTVVGVVAISTLIVLLSVKELLSATEMHGQSVSNASIWSSRATLLTDKITIPIYSLLFVFAAIVATEIITILG